MRIAALGLCALLLVPGASALLGVDLPLGDDDGTVLVGYRDGALDAVLSLVASLGADVLHEVDDIDVLVVSTDDVAGFLLAIVAGSGVDYAEKNDEVRMMGSQWNGAQWNGAQWNGDAWDGTPWQDDDDNASTADPGLPWQWGLAATKAPLAWQTTQGSDAASLCVLDSGLAWDHADLAPNVGASRGINLIDPAKNAYDDAGHGTHVAGVAAGAVGNAHGIAGVGNAQILPVKVLDANGKGLESNLARGIVWCANQGAHVALMALSVTQAGPTLRRAIDHARDHDVLLVASAGNGGCADCVAYPASDDDVLAVGALTQTLSRASFSSRGKEVDLAAPGVNILGPFLDDSFVYGSGTSQAAALVAGAAALVRSAHPDLSAEQTRARLLDTAHDVGPRGTDASFGRGLVDVAAAVEA